MAINSKITEKTLIPITLVVVLMGFVFWLSALYATSTLNTTEVLQLKKDFEHYRTSLWSTIHDQDKRLARIEGKIDILINKTTKEK